MTISRRQQSTSDATIDGPTEDDIKFASLRHIVKAKDLLPYFLGKTWILQRNESDAEFYISDSPITLDNIVDYSPRGSLGLAVPGVQLHVPLSPRLGLAFYCPTIERTLRRKHEELRGVRSQLVDSHRPSDQLESLLSAIDSGTPDTLDSQNVLYLNELQVMFAARFVFAMHDDFEVARRIARDNPQYKHGVLPRRIG